MADDEESRPLLGHGESLDELLPRYPYEPEEEEEEEEEGEGGEEEGDTSVLIDALRTLADVVEETLAPPLPNEDRQLDRQLLLIQAEAEGELEDMAPLRPETPLLATVLTGLPEEVVEEIIPADEHTRGLLGSTMTLLNDVIGPSIVAFPYYTAAGVPAIMAAFLLYALLNAGTLVLMREMCVRRQIYSFPELCLAALGRPGFMASLLLIFLFNWGGGVASALIIGDVGESLFDNWCSTSEQKHLCTRTNLLVLAYVLGAPLAFFKSIGRFALISSISQLCQMVAILTLVVLTILHGRDRDWHIQDDASHNLWHVQSRVMSAIGGLSYMFACHDMSVHVLTGLRRATPKRWAFISFSVPFMLVIYCVVLGLLGYLFVGPTQNLLSDPAFGDSHIIIGVRTLLLVACTFNIPFNVFMPRMACMGFLQVLLPAWTIKQVHVPGNKWRRTLLHATVTLLILGSSLGTAIAVHNLGTFLEVVGMAGVALALILPSACYLLLHRHVVHSKEASSDLHLQNSSVPGSPVIHVPPTIPEGREDASSLGESEKISPQPSPEPTLKAFSSAAEAEERRERRLVSFSYVAFVFGIASVLSIGIGIGIE